MLNLSLSVAHRGRHENLTFGGASDKQTIPWATSLRATHETTALENYSARYSAINFAIRWPL